MGTARQNRGRRTNVVVADWLRQHGWPDAQPTWGSEPGKDAKGVHGHSVEVKARRDFNPMAWLRQAKANAVSSERPCVILRCDGQGEASVGEFLVIRRLEDDELAQDRSMTLTNRGQIAYEAYGRVTDHKNYRGEPMPAWDDLPEPIKLAWIQAAVAAWRGYV